MVWFPIGAVVIAASAALLWAQRRGGAQRRRTPPKKTGPTKPLDRFGVPELAARLEISEDALRAFEPRYHVFSVGKAGKQRKIQAPDEETKALQRKILRRVLAKLRVHPAVKGFEPGCSVADNAAAHAHQEIVIKLDLIDFFGSTRADRIERYFRFVGWTQEAAELLTRLTTYEGALPQGAPSSPALSNRVNYGLDASIARDHRGSYTRYADDITISFARDHPRIARGVVQHVQRTAKRFGYRVHTGKKLRILRRHQSQRVTGLVVNDGVRVPRETRRWLRAVEHRLASGKEATLTRAELEGWKAYVAFVDRTRPGAAELRTRLKEALMASQHSPTYAAERFGCSKRVFVELLKEHGLWDPRPNRTVPERKWS